MSLRKMHRGASEVMPTTLPRGPHRFAAGHPELQQSFLRDERTRCAKRGTRGAKVYCGLRAFLSCCDRHPLAFDHVEGFGDGAAGEIERFERCITQRLFGATQSCGAS